MGQPISIEEYNRKLRDKLDGFDDFARKTMLIETNTTLTNVKQDVREKGLPGEEYSEGYSAYKRKKGRQTSKVDLNFTGRMLNNIQIFKVEPTGQNNITAFISPSQSGEKTKFAANQKRYGNILPVTIQHKKEFAQNYTKALIRYLND